VLAASIIRATSKPRCLLVALLMEAASTSETSVNVYQTTRRNNPEYSHLHAGHRENLKSHNVKMDLEETGRGLDWIHLLISTHSFLYEVPLAVSQARP
jgi:hypothetical protein